MRQAGILAAAGLIALEEMPARLPEDHENAKFLADSLASVPGVAIDKARVQTNIVIFDISATKFEAQTVSAKLKQRGVLANAISPTHLRMVTHYDVTREMCDAAVGVLREICTSR